jgi:hypothetical protein
MDCLVYQYHEKSECVSCQHQGVCQGTDSCSLFLRLDRSEIPALIRRGNGRFDIDSSGASGRQVLLVSVFGCAARAVCLFVPSPTRTTFHSFFALSDSQIPVSTACTFHPPERNNSTTRDAEHTAKITLIYDIFRII